jgi:hypothetical protein
MTLDEFLRWDDRADTHYELIDSFPVAISPQPMLGPISTRINITLSVRHPGKAQSRRLNPA